MVFQNYALYPHMTVFDNMAYGLKIAKVPEAEIRARVDKAAAILELAPFLARKPRELSGGQRQRVAMGRAIVRQPAVFLFDEPLSNLDAKLRAQMRLEIQKLHRELRTTSLYVTHDQVEAMTLAERMIVMNAGRIEQIGTPDEVYHRPATTFVAGFIGSPPMNFVRGHAAGRTASPPAASRCRCRGAAPRDGDAGAGHPARARRDRPRPERRRLAAARAGDRDARRRAARLRPRSATTLFTARLDATLPHPAVGDIVSHPRVARRTCTGSTPRPRRASAPDRRGATRAMTRRPGPTRAGSRTAAPASSRPRTRSPPFASARRTAIARSSATSSSSADGVPFLLHDATLERTTTGRGPAAALSWGELSRLDAGGWHSRALRRRAAAELRRRSRATACATASRSTSRSSPRRARERETGRVVAAMAARALGRRRDAAAADVVPADCARRRARRGAARCRARLLLDTLARPAGSTRRGARLRRRGHEPCARSTRRCSRRCTPPACARLVYTVNDPAEARRLDRARHRRHRHRRGRSLLARATASRTSAANAHVRHHTLLIRVLLQGPPCSRGGGAAGHALQPICRSKS